ncbi:MAG: DNA-binding MarR family transcriptional regulator [Hyphomicrobiaceae bacterium]
MNEKNEKSAEETATSSRCACLNLRQAARAITQLYDEALRPTGLRATQLAVLGTAKGSPCISVCKLAELLVLDRTTLTRNLKPLEKRGLIRVETCDDRRTRSICITDEGSEVLAQAIPLWEAIQQRVVGELGLQRYDRLVDDLTETVRIAQT